MHRMWGGDLIGMTCMPEAKLAREAELCYALIAIPTDYDCWRPPQRHERPGALMEQIVANLKKGTQAAVSLIRAVLSEVRSLSERSCGCGSAMEPAIWSDPKKLTAEVRSRLAPLIGRYVGLPDPDGG